MGRYPDSAESLGGREELVQGHRLAEGEPLSEYPLSRLDPAHEGGVGFRPDGSSGGSFQEYVALLASSAWKTGKTCSALFSATREQAHDTPWGRKP